MHCESHFEMIEILCSLKRINFEHPSGTIIHITGMTQSIFDSEFVDFSEDSAFFRNMKSQLHIDAMPQL